MKIKFLMTLLFVAGLAFTTMAQTISVGPRLGATFSTIKSDEFEEVDMDTKSNTGLQVGAVLNVGINDLWSIQPELLYIQKGTKVAASLEEGGESYKLNGEIKTSYVELPVLAKVTFGNDNLKGFVTAGPTLGYWLNGKSKAKLTYSFEGEKEIYQEEQEVDFDDDEDGKENRLETGVSFGVGLGYNVGSGTLNFDVRYGLGLSNLAEVEDGDKYETKNRVLGISVAYLFGL